MANTDSPFGFVPIGTTDGSDYHGKMREVEFLDTDAVACFIGDMVKLTWHYGCRWIHSSSSTSCGWKLNDRGDCRVLA